MNESINKNNSAFLKEDEIDLLDLAKKLLRHWILILVIILLGGTCAGAYSYFRIPPSYKAECMMYVNNGSISIGSAAVSLQDLNASQSLVDTYLVILRSRRVLNRVAEETGVEYSYERLRDMVSGSKVDGTEVFKIYVTSGDPEEAERLTNKIAEVLPEAISDIVEGSSAKIVDYAVIPQYKVGPNNVKNAAMGAMFGFVAICGILVLLILLDNTVQSVQDLFANNNYPLLAVVPEHTMNIRSKKNYASRYREHSGEKARTASSESRKKKSYEKTYIGDDLPFASKEAYNLLRTNLIYSLVDGTEGKVIGITSSTASEYKSTTAINLAISFARANKKVLLLDCDLRLSFMAKHMGLEEKPGVSDYLAGSIPVENLIQHPEAYPSLSVIVSGTHSPNPAELLGSERMAEMIRRFVKEYEYIIVDFSPVNVVADSLVLGKSLDGVVLVARQNYTQKAAYAESLRKLKFLDIPILGLVLTGAGSGKKYGKKYSYEKYYSK